MFVSHSAIQRSCLTLTLAILTILTACGSKEEPSSTATRPESSPTVAAAAPTASSVPDPCTLLTKAEAASILGEPTSDPEAGSLGGNKICDFKSVKLHGGIAPYSIHIALTPEKRESWDAGKKLHLDAKEAHAAPEIGDDAYFLLDDLEVYAKQLAINVNVLKDIDRPSHTKSVQEAEKAVAEKAIPRL
jgi:hypothetical protein